jgi:hypothetical protein
MDPKGRESRPAKSTEQRDVSDRWRILSVRRAVSMSFSLHQALPWIHLFMVVDCSQTTPSAWRYGLDVVLIHRL